MRGAGFEVCLPAPLPSPASALSFPGCIEVPAAARWTWRPGPPRLALPRHLPAGSQGWVSSSEAEPGGLRLPWRWFPWKEGKGLGLKTQPGEGAAHPLKEHEIRQRVFIPQQQSPMNPAAPGPPLALSTPPAPCTTTSQLIRKDATQTFICTGPSSPLPNQLRMRHMQKSPLSAGNRYYTTYCIII